MLEALRSQPPAELPRPPRSSRERSQIEAFMVLRRNPLELWGPMAYREEVLRGRFLGREQILLNDPEAIRRVLVANHENYGRNIGTKRVLRPVLGDGLFLAEGEAWRHQRRTVAPALAPRTMPILARHVVLATAEAEAKLARVGGKPVDLLKHLQYLALTIAGRSMFSLEMESYGDELRAMLLRYALGYARVGFLDLLLPETMRTPLDVGRGAFRTEWLRFVDRLIDAREAQGERAPPDRPRDLFDLLSSARDPETGAGFDRAQLRDEVATLIIAGHETTAASLFWACYAAARLPEHQERIAEEAAGVDLSPENAAAAIKRLPYTRAHIDETLRLYPPAFLIVREALGPDTVGGKRIAAGTVVSVSPWVLHRHRRRWRNPDSFDPTRFLPGATPPDRFAYLPFGAGPRICVGAQFALTEATLVLARLFRAFRIEPFGNGTVMPRGFVTTQPDRPVRFLLSRRVH